MSAPCRADLHPPRPPRGLTTEASPPPQLKARCEELKLDWSTLSLENLLKEKQALRSQISEKQRHCLELQVGAPLGLTHHERGKCPRRPPETTLLPRTGRGPCRCSDGGPDAPSWPAGGGGGRCGGGAGLGVRGAPLTWSRGGSGSVRNLGFPRRPCPPGGGCRSGPRGGQRSRTPPQSLRCSLRTVTCASRSAGTQGEKEGGAEGPARPHGPRLPADRVTPRPVVLSEGLWPRRPLLLSQQHVAQRRGPPTPSAGPGPVPTDTPAGGAAGR